MAVVVPVTEFQQSDWSPLAARKLPHFGPPVDRLKASDGVPKVCCEATDIPCRLRHAKPQLWSQRQIYIVSVPVFRGTQESPLGTRIQRKLVRKDFALLGPSPM